LGMSFLSKAGTFNSSGVRIGSPLTKWAFSPFPYHNASHPIKLKNEIGKSIAFFSNCFMVLALWVTG
jgi:hypothetical protein